MNTCLRRESILFDQLCEVHGLECLDNVSHFVQMLEDLMIMLLAIYSLLLCLNRWIVDFIIMLSFPSSQFERVKGVAMSR